MQHRKTGDSHVLSIARGEWVHETIVAFCRDHAIENAWLSGLGAADFVRCGYYDLTEKTYHFTEYDAMYEVVHYTGNVMRKDDGLFVHAHAAFSDTANALFGGHVAELRVGIVLEVLLTPLPSAITRVHDEAIGLHLMNVN